MTEDEMTDDASPENLRKFLESDDPAMVLMGLSMAKGSGVPEELLPTILGIYMWDDDKSVRGAAKSMFFKHAPAKLQAEVKKKWHHSYRKLEFYRDKFTVVFSSLLQSHDDIAMPVLHHLLKSHNPGYFTDSSRANYHESGIAKVFERLTKIQPILFKAFDHETAEIRCKSIDALRWSNASKYSIGRTVGEYFFKALEDENENVRRIASIVIGNAYYKYGVTRQNDRAVKSLIKALGDNSEEVRKEVAIALGRLGDKRATEPLIKALEDKSVEFRKQVVWALGMISRRNNKIKHKQSCDIHYGEDCNCGLGMHGPNQATEPLLKLLEGKDTELHSPVAAALGQIGDKRAIPFIAKLDNPGLLQPFRTLGLIAIVGMGYGETLSVDELKRCLKEKKLSTSGAKSVLVQRLNQHLSPTKLELETPKNIHKKDKAIAKLLTSDKPAQIKKGLSKNIPEELMELVTTHYLWHDDKTVRASAKKTFFKQAPENAQKLIKALWKNKYRNAAAPPLRTLIESLETNSFQNISKAVRSVAVKKADDFIRAQKHDRFSTKEFARLEALVSKPNPIYKFIKPNPDSETSIGEIVVAIDAVSNAKDAEATDLVFKCIDSKEASIRNAAARATGVFDEKFIKPLIDMLKDKEPYVSTTALLSLNWIISGHYVEGDRHQYRNNYSIDKSTKKLIRKHVQESFLSTLEEGFKVGGYEVELEYAYVLSNFESTSIRLSDLGTVRNENLCLNFTCNCPSFINYNPKYDGDPNCKHIHEISSMDWCLRYDFVDGEITSTCLNKYIKTLKNPSKKWQEISGVADKLAYIGDDRAVRPLIKKLTSIAPGKKFASAREAIIAALGTFRDKHAVKSLIGLLKDKDEDIRARAALSLGMIKDKRAVEPLIEALEDKYWFARGRAAEALGKISDVRSVEPLIKALEEGNSFAKEALEKLGHEME